MRLAPTDSRREVIASTASNAGPRDEYLTIAEAATMLKVSSKRVRNLMSNGTFKQGDHFFRRRGLGPRFLRSRLDAWLRGDGQPPSEIPMARGTRPVVAGGANPA